MNQPSDEVEPGASRDEVERVDATSAEGHDMVATEPVDTGPTSAIEGSVSAILNRRELVINRGSLNGVTAGMRFAVLNRHGFEVRDPESNKILGSIDVEKTVVEVVRVEERLAVARTFRRSRVNVGGLAVGLEISKYFEPRKYVTKFETLEVDPTTAGYVELDEEDSFIKVGDPVRQVIGDEYLVGD